MSAFFLLRLEVVGWLEVDLKVERREKRVKKQKKEERRGESKIETRKKIERTRFVIVIVVSRTVLALVGLGLYELLRVSFAHQWLAASYSLLSSLGIPLQSTITEIYPHNNEWSSSGKACLRNA